MTSRMCLQPACSVARLGLHTRAYHVSLWPASQRLLRPTKSNSTRVHRQSAYRFLTRAISNQTLQQQQDAPTPPRKDLYENIWTVPNALTVSRLIACPFLGYFILHNQMDYAVALLVYAGATDLIDGWLARKYHLESVMGSILDPAADKALVTTLTVTLAMNGLLPVPLAVLIIGRDVGLSISAFYWRYITLPPPKSFTRFWDFSIPSASVHPTTISKYNTFLQLCLMGVTTISPLLPFSISTFLLALQSTVGVTTIWSGLSYLTTTNAVKVLKK